LKLPRYNINLIGVLFPPKKWNQKVSQLHNQIMEIDSLQV